MQRISKIFEVDVTCKPAIEVRSMRRRGEMVASLDKCTPPPSPTNILHTANKTAYPSNIKDYWNVTSSSSSNSSSEHKPNAGKTSCDSTAMAGGQSIEIKKRELGGNRRSDEEMHENWFIHSCPLVWSGLGPVCPVPMLPDWEKILGLKPPLFTTVETQTSPVNHSTSSSLSNINSDGDGSTTQSSNLTSSGAACAREGVRRNRRSLCECLADCLKKKVVRVRRSLKSHFMNEENFVENTVVVEEGVDFQSACTSASCFRTRRKGNGGVWCVQVSMLGICEDGSCRIQLRRECNYQPFGVHFKKRWQRLYMCGIVKRVEVKWSGEGEFQMKGRVLEVQGVPSEKLDMRGIGELLKGCLVLTVRMRAADVR
ncbi:hypothetical protein Aperf_G00000111156 [Anoplocephala perfoliata]